MPLVSIRKDAPTLTLLPESDSLPFTERMRNKNINELIRTEQDYLTDLQLVVRMFRKPLLERGIITEEQDKSIFFNIPVLCAKTQDVLAKYMFIDVFHPDGPKLAATFNKLV
jgi:hypothetical protein